MKISFLIPIFSTLFLFTACEIETDESNRYDVLQLIDDGQFSSALQELGDCSDPKGFTREECYINRGMSYFGLAGYDIISIGEEMYRVYSNDAFTDNEKSIKVMSVLFSRFKGNYMAYGLLQYKLALNASGNDPSICVSQDFSNLSDNQQQSCISINPVLLLDIIDNKGETQDSQIAVDLEDLIAIEKSVRGVAPNISNEEMAYLLSNDIEKTSQNTQNEIDATQCLIVESHCFDLGFQNPKHISDYKNFKVWKLSKVEDSFTTIKLTNNNSVLLLEENLYIRSDGTSCSEDEYKNYDGKCFPKPVEDNSTLISNVVDKLNEDHNFRNSIALMLNIGDEETSENAQINGFMSDICGYPNCQVTEENLIQYFNGKE